MTTKSKGLLRCCASHVWVLVLVLPLLAGCVTAKGPTYMEARSQIPGLSSEMARIYVLRDDQYALYAALVRMHINGVHELNLVNGGFTYIDIKPGTTSVMADVENLQGDSMVKVNTEPGGQYYVYVTTNRNRVKTEALLGIFANFMDKGAPFLVQQVTEDWAQELLPKLNFSS